MKQRDYALGARIKAAMKSAGYSTAKTFCEEHHIPYLTFAQHTQGRRHPTDAFLKKYSKLFGVTVQWLRTGEGNPLSRASSQKQKKIETSFQNEIKKSQSSATINTQLLALILEKVSGLRKSHKLSEKKCAKITANLYAQILNTTHEKTLQEKMVLVFIKTYEASLK